MRLVSTLVRELEPQMLHHVERGLMNMAALVTDRTDLEMVVPELIRLLGEDSKALRALKMVRHNSCFAPKEVGPIKQPLPPFTDPTTTILELFEMEANR